MSLKLKKGSIAFFKNTQDGSYTPCVIIKYGNMATVVFFHEKENKLKQYINVVTQMLTPAKYSDLPDELKAYHTKHFSTLKKGACVQFSFDGETYIGVVVRGGHSVTVRYDTGEVKGLASFFTEVPQNAIPLDPPSVMDKWSVREFKEFKELSEETIAFHAVIYLNNVPVFYAKNSGHGGCMSLSQHENATLEDTDDFDRDLFTWATQFGLKGKAFELDEEWLLWFVYEKSCFVTAKQHFINANNYGL